MKARAIVTKYLRPTAYRGGRISAVSREGHIVASYDHELSTAKNHERAAKLLVRKLELKRAKISGGVELPDGRHVWTLKGSA